MTQYLIEREMPGAAAITIIISEIARVSSGPS